MQNIYDECHVAGGMSAYEWERDPKRILFILARYKFVAKMLEGKELVLEVGCADGYGSRVVRQHVQNLDAIDIDTSSIVEAQQNCSPKWPINFMVRDILEQPRRLHGYDAVYALDLFEHFYVEQESVLLESLYDSASVCIIGTPSLESQAHASKLSKEGHVNCVSGHALKTKCLAYWDQVFMFSMNDEVVHTGFSPMSHYNFVLCVR